MFGRKKLAERVDEVIAVASREDADPESAQRSVLTMLDAAKKAPVSEQDDAVTRLADVLPNLGFLRASLIAIACGTLVENGANYALAAKPILTRFGDAVQRAVPFAEACRAEASAATPAEGEDDQLDQGAALQQFGRQVMERMPEAGNAFGSLEWLSTAALAMLCRSQALRAELKANGPVVAAIAKLAAVGFELPCFREMLSLLDDKELVVLHPALAKGYRIRIAGIGDNFQLHTLLADALIGNEAAGLLPGTRPPADVAAMAKDAPVPDRDDLPAAHGAFNLWNWTGLQSDGTLPDDQAASRAHWIWNEGVPADIVPFEGTRIVLLGPPPYPRSWNSGRFFPAMKAELDVLSHLSESEVHEWLSRLANAPKPAVAGRDVTADDVRQV